MLLKKYQPKLQNTLIMVQSSMNHLQLLLRNIFQINLSFSILKILPTPKLILGFILLSIQKIIFSFSKRQIQFFIERIEKVQDKCFNLKISNKEMLEIATFYLQLHLLWKTIHNLSIDFLFWKKIQLMSMVSDYLLMELGEQSFLMPASQSMPMECYVGHNLIIARFG